MEYSKGTIEEILDLQKLLKKIGYSDSQINQILIESIDSKYSLSKKEYEYMKDLDIEYFITLFNGATLISSTDAFNVIKVLSEANRDLKKQKRYIEMAAARQNTEFSDEFTAEIIKLYLDHSKSLTTGYKIINLAHKISEQYSSINTKAILAYFLNYDVDLNSQKVLLESFIDQPSILDRLDPIQIVGAHKYFKGVLHLEKDILDMTIASRYSCTKHNHNNNHIWDELHCERNFAIKCFELLFKHGVDPLIYKDVIIDVCKTAKSSDEEDHIYKSIMSSIDRYPIFSNENMQEHVQPIYNDFISNNINQLENYDIQDLENCLSEIRGNIAVASDLDLPIRSMQELIEQIYDINVFEAILGTYDQNDSNIKVDITKPRTKIKTTGEGDKRKD